MHGIVYVLHYFIQRMAKILATVNKYIIHLGLPLPLPPPKKS